MFDGFFVIRPSLFCSKPRQTSQYLIKTDFPEGNTSEQQLFGRNLECYLHYFQYQMRCYRCIFRLLNTKIRENTIVLHELDVPSINVLK